MRFPNEKGIDLDEINDLVNKCKKNRVKDFYPLSELLLKVKKVNLTSFEIDDGRVLQNIMKELMIYTNSRKIITYCYPVNAFRLADNSFRLIRFPRVDGRDLK